MDRPSPGQLFDGEVGRVAAPDRSFARARSTRSGAGAGVTARGPYHCTREGLAPRGSTNPSSVSRPAEPGASYCTVSTRFDSSIAGFDSRHRALSPRWRELGRDVERGPFDAPPCSRRSRNGCGVSSIQNQRYGRAPYPLTRVARVGVRYAGSHRGRPYPGRMRESSLGEVGLTTRLFLAEARSSSPVQPSVPEATILGVRAPSREIDTQPLMSGDRTLSSCTPKWHPQPPQ